MKVPSSEASTSSAPPAQQPYYGYDLRSWIHDELVDMDSFWPHVLLSVLETVLGACLVLFVQCLLGGPWFRYTPLLLFTSLIHADYA